MAKMTLLTLTQAILNDMDGDQVNSINDTFESEQVAVIVRDTYKAMIDNRNWPHLKRLIQLTSSGDVNFPTYLTVPTDVKQLLTINYDKRRTGETRRRYEKISWLEPDDFLRVVNGRNNDSANTIIVTDPTGVELLIMNDRAPTYFTSFNDETIVMDSYDTTVDSTIQESKTQSRAVVAPVWTHLDTFIPDLPEEAFTALLEEAKSRAMFKLKQMQDIKSEQESTRQQRWLSRKAWKVNGGVRYPDYGRRKGRFQSHNPPLDQN